GPLSLCVDRRWLACVPAHLRPEACTMSVMSRSIEIPRAMRVAPPAVLGGRRAARLVERNIVSYRRMWGALASGVFEPIFYLYSLGIGLGALVGTVQGPGGHAIKYALFVAPGLLAASAMNGAILDATFGLFFKIGRAHV